MSWLKRQQPVQLYQSSDLPYVILEDGVHLFCDNCFGTQPDNEDFNLSFYAEASQLKRINTYFYRLASFPFIVPFEEVIFLNDAIIEGKTIKHFASSDGEAKSSESRNRSSGDNTSKGDEHEDCTSNNSFADGTRSSVDGDDIDDKWLWPQPPDIVKSGSMNINRRVGRHLEIMMVREAKAFAPPRDQNWNGSVTKPIMSR